MDPSSRAKPAHNQASLDLVDQIASLIESTAALQRTTTRLLSRLPPHLIIGASTNLARPDDSHVDLDTPQSALPSTLAPGVPIPSRGWQQDHSPKKKIVAETKARLIQDGWEDCEDTDAHAARLSDAMLRLGMEDIDNFTTEASRLNCSNMAITATLVSAIVATFYAETYNQNDSLHMRIVNGLWFSSLFLSLATATLCMLVSEWLTWSTSQELRDHSIIYRLIKTALRSAIMHLTIFLFFGGLFVMMWNESPWSVCIAPTIFCGIFSIYYIAATLRAPLLSFFGGIRQFDAQDFRGLRVQIWTPFTLGTHHTFNYILILVVKPIRRLIWGSDVIEKSKDIQTETPEIHINVYDSKAASSNDAPALSSPPGPIIYADPESLSQQATRTTRPVSPSDAHCTLHNSNPTQSPSPLPESGPTVNNTETGDTDEKDTEFRRKLRAIRMRRVTEHEVIGGGRTRRRTVDA